ncbi:MAG: L,D-transpeptidase family protein [Firmicutes bacterium]|nr:L,D-transpeptidase family protein [Alicyclobacillaceae bacterium]MCL6496146.1 L,D-transpeptidase family protein [Bacillota bacterium]
MKEARWTWIHRGLWALAAALVWTGLRPTVSHGAPPPATATHIVIDVAARRLTLYRGAAPIATWPVAVGKPNTPSPRGEFVITQKAIWGDGFGTRWMRISVPWGIYGIHGTNKPWTVGTVASHGCFRMYNRDVEALYDQVQIGTPVTVVGPTPYATIRRTLTPGRLGQDVVELERLLRQAGVYPGPLEGLYTDAVTEAVRRFQAMTGLSPTGIADAATVERLKAFTAAPQAATRPEKRFGGRPHPPG